MNRDSRPSLRLRPIAVSRETAASMLGEMSVDSFERYVQPHLRLVRCGRLRLIPVTELERWVAENAEHVGVGDER
jgi:hypothetical protein